MWIAEQHVPLSQQADVAADALSELNVRHQQIAKQLRAARQSMRQRRRLQAAHIEKESITRETESKQKER
jgi:hypothetical protein